jgi:hypothetical protein
MEPKDYTNHSGGAKGADMKWDEVGRKYGVTEHVHWRPQDLYQLPEDVLAQMKYDVRMAAKVLMRPFEGFKGVELIHRNWLQVKYGDAIYAIAHIVPPGEVDYQGYENKTGKEIVAGGTGWAVEMAIQKGKPVYVFDMTTNFWYIWEHENDKFAIHEQVPTLTKDFAGIGSRILTPQGEQAIEDVYIKTFNHAKEGGKEEENQTS